MLLFLVCLFGTDRFSICSSVAVYCISTRVTPCSAQRRRFTDCFSWSLAKTIQLNRSRDEAISHVVQTVAKKTFNLRTIDSVRNLHQGNAMLYAKLTT